MNAAVTIMQNVGLLEDVSSMRPKGPCRNCGARQATTWWVEDGGVLAWAHGMGQPWCEPCCTARAIAHAKEMAAKLPKLQLDAERMKLLEVFGRKILG